MSLVDCSVTKVRRNERVVRTPTREIVEEAALRKGERPLRCSRAEREADDEDDDACDAPELHRDPEAVSA